MIEFILKMVIKCNQAQIFFVRFIFYRKVDLHSYTEPSILLFKSKSYILGNKTTKNRSLFS